MHNSLLPFPFSSLHCALFILHSAPSGGTATKADSKHFRQTYETITWGWCGDPVARSSKTFFQGLKSPMVPDHSAISRKDRLVVGAFDNLSLFSSMLARIPGGDLHGNSCREKHIMCHLSYCTWRIFLVVFDSGQ